MDKLYSKVGWKNEPNKTTPINETNLGKMDNGINDLDDRVIELNNSKVDKVTGKGLSTNDYTNAEKQKLADISSGAEVNVQSDWNQTTTTADDYIKNKPQNLVSDANYVHTDNNYTTTEKNKLSGIQAGAQVNSVTSVAGKTGAVTLVKGDVGLGNVDNTSDTNKPISTATQNALNNKADKSTTYTKTEVDNKFSTLETNIDWKEAVNTYNDIATTYPNPVDGWTVNVKDTDYTYRYSGSQWVAISANAIPQATTSVNGLMTTSQVTKLNSIESGAQVNTVTSVAGKTGDVQLTKSDVSLGNVDNTSDMNKPVSTATQNALKRKANIATTLAGYGIEDAYTKTVIDELLDTKADISKLKRLTDDGSTSTGGDKWFYLAETELDDYFTASLTAPVKPRYTHRLKGLYYIFVSNAGFEDACIFTYDVDPYGDECHFKFLCSTGNIIDQVRVVGDLSNNKCSLQYHISANASGEYLRNAAVIPFTDYEMWASTNTSAYGSNMTIVGTVDVPLSGEARMDEIESDIDGAKTVSGSIITLSDASATNLQECKVSIEAVQDLHGYGHPWVGGAGKNLLPMTVDGIKSLNTSGTWSGNNYTLNGITFTIQTDSDGNVIGIKVNGTASADVEFILPNANNPLTTTVLSGCPSNGSASTYFLTIQQYNGSGQWGAKSSDYGSGVNYLGTAYIYLSSWITIKSGYTANNLLYKPMIRLASETDSTFEPYSNICPISGWSAVDVTKTGKNIANAKYRSKVPSIISGQMVATNGWSTEYIKVDNSKTYCASVGNDSTSYLLYYDSNFAFLGGIQFSLSTRVDTESYFSGASYIKLRNDAEENNNPHIQLELGSTATTYEPYNGATYTIDLDGTRYGGKVDLVSGVLTLTYGYIASYNGETLPSTWISDRDVYAEGTTPTTGAEVVYELATPTTIQLTPQQIRLLKGTNNISCNTGDLSIKYQPDNIIGDIIEHIEEEYGSLSDDISINSGTYNLLKVKKSYLDETVRYLKSLGYTSSYIIPTGGDTLYEDSTVEGAIEVNGSSDSYDFFEMVINFYCHKSGDYVVRGSRDGKLVVNLMQGSTTVATIGGTPDYHERGYGVQKIVSLEKGKLYLYRVLIPTAESISDELYPMITSVENADKPYQLVIDNEYEAYQQADINDFNALSSDIDVSLSNSALPNYIAVAQNRKWLTVDNNHVPYIDGDYIVTFVMGTYRENISFRVYGDGTGVDELSHFGSGRVFSGVRVVYGHNGGHGDTRVYADSIELICDTAQTFTGSGKLSIQVIPNEKMITNYSINGYYTGQEIECCKASEELAYTIQVTSTYSSNMFYDKTPKVYGYHIEDSESDPSAKITYLADAIGMTPAKMNYSTGKFDYGSWKDIWFVKECKPCILAQAGYVMKYLDPNDYTKDVDGNTVAIDGGLVGANVMIEFPKIWYKVVPDYGDENSASVYISPVKVDEGYKDYAYIDYQGHHKEHFYMPAYNGSLIDGVMRSLSGQQVSKGKTGQQEIDYCKANGDGWYTEDVGEIMLINFLLILMGKSTDTQTVYGQGLHTGGSEAINDGFRTGVHDMKGLFYGTNSGAIASGSYSNAVKVFGIENYWGFQWRRYAGDMLVNGVRKIKMCYGNEDGSTSFNFNGTGEGYVNVGQTPSGTNGGYISKMKFTHDGMYSAVSSGSSSTNYCDGQWFNNSYPTIYALRGGSSFHGLLVGAFCVDLSLAFASAWWPRGAAPSYK